jgi:2-methylcitrate dehydratase PrpD
VTALEGLCGWAAGLRLSRIPERVRAYAISQVISQLAAVRAGQRPPYGRSLRRLYGSPLGTDPRAMASVLCGLGAWLHADDTAYAGHLSLSTVSTPLAYAYHDGLDGPALLSAVVAANETAARIAAAATLGPHRGQTALHTHVAGAVAGRLHAEQAPAGRWVDAMALALSAPGLASVHGSFAASGKVLTPVFPLRHGLDACDAAAAGFAGPADIIEHADGFLSHFAEVALPFAVTAGLGQRWHTDTLSFKLRPGGPGVDAAVDAAISLHHECGPVDPDQIERIVVATSIYTLLADQRAASYLCGQDSPPAALVLAAAYPVATALLRGALDSDDFWGVALADEARWELAAKVQVEHDEAMTVALLGATAPFGEALREGGEQALAWLDAMGGPWLRGLAEPLGPPSTTFETAEKVTPARVEVHWRDGRISARQVDIPLGAAGPDTARRHRELVCAKLAATGVGAPTIAALEHLDALSAGQLRHALIACLSKPSSASTWPADVHLELAGRRP